MNFKLHVLVLSILYCVQSSYSDRPVTGKALPLENSRLGIYDGTPTTIEKHPYLVKTFIHSKIQTRLDPSELIVVAGSDDSSTGITYTVQTVTLHPHYGETVYDYDYACVQINGSFKWSNKVRPIKLPRREPKVNANLMVAGWGDTSDERGKQSNSQLMQGKMKWLAKKVCEATWADYGITWTERMACAYNKGKTTLCSGDWADAFVKKGLFYGMFAAGGGGFCSSSAIPVLIADIVPAAAWIKQTTGATLEDL
ncbi:hypothetical protein J6590_046495 [Homalodisca vitripennis]|nr:hypothetical protein J6590_046495 [Homalodisca vitripennis]